MLSSASSDYNFSYSVFIIVFFVVKPGNCIQKMAELQGTEKINLSTIQDITYSVAKRVPLVMILWPLPCRYAGEIKGCHNEGIMISLQEVIKRPLKGIIPMRGF